MNKGICYGVSVGPGREDLITLEAVRIIKEADIIILPSFPKEKCRAYTIVKKSMPEIDDKDIRCQNFPMSRSASVMAMRHQEIFEETAALLEEGKTAAFLALGEAGLYSTYLYIHEKLIAAGCRSVLVSGISSVQAICAQLNIPLAMGNDPLHVFPDTSDLDTRLMLPGTKVFMKPKGDMTGAIHKLQAFVSQNPQCRAYGVSNSGMEGEVIARSAAELEKLSGYFTVLIVTGNADVCPTDKRNTDASQTVPYPENGRPGRDEDATYFENRSCKYYPCHKGTDHINCLFCYCPMYGFESCPGNPSYIQKGSKVVKNCSSCTYPHVKEHYSRIMDFLKSIGGTESAKESAAFHSAQ